MPRGQLSTSASSSSSFRRLARERAQPRGRRRRPASRPGSRAQRRPTSIVASPASEGLLQLAPRPAAARAWPPRHEPRSWTSLNPRAARTCEKMPLCLSSSPRWQWTSTPDWRRLSTSSAGIDVLLREFVARGERLVPAAPTSEGDRSAPPGLPTRRGGCPSCRRGRATRPGSRGHRRSGRGGSSGRRG